MNVTDLLARAGGLSSIARELGVNEQQVSSGAAALLPALMGGFRKQAQAGGGGDAVADEEMRQRAVVDSVFQAQGECSM